MTPLLDVDALEARYGQIPVLRGVSLSVAEGESVGLLGPNGHGKTTLLRTLSALMRPSAGRAEFRSTNLAGLSSRQVVELGLVHIPQGPRLFPNCTVGETLRLGAFSSAARSGYGKMLEQVFELFPRLHERRNQTCGTLSGGERQMVAIGAGLMARPKLLALDEPTLGLAPKVKLELRDKIEQIRASGVTLIVVDGDVEFMLSLTDRWYAMELGSITASGRSDMGLEERMVVDMYFKGHGGVDG